MSCVLKSDSGGEKRKKKSKCNVLCGQPFLQDTSGEFVNEKEAWVFIIAV